MMKRILAICLFMLVSTGAFAQAPIVGPMPYQLQNGTIADANQVMANFNFIANATNSGAAIAGANNNITSLTGLTTPITPAQGGTTVYYGGTSSNTGNTYTIASPTPNGFSLTAGRTIVFIANATNTGPTTLNVGGTGFINVYRQTTSGGAIAMSGGEINANQMIAAVYDGTEFQCTNCTTASLVPAGTTVDFSGVVIPAGWVLANGTTLNRTAYTALFNALAYTAVAATTISSGTSVTVPNSSLFQIGWFVGGSNVTCNVTITAIPDGTHVTISAAAGSGGATTLTIGPYQQGDCSTTFNLPNYTGRFLASADGSTNITATTCTNAGTVGTICGGQTHTVAQANLPNVNFAVNFGTITTTITQNANSNNSSSGTPGPFTAPLPTPAAATITASTTIGPSTAASGGSGTPLSTLPPAAIVLKIIKT